MRNKITKICKVCGKKFNIALIKKYRKTCSKKCRYKLVSISEKNSEAVKSFHSDPIWREKQRLAKLGKPSPRKGQHHKKDTKQKLSNIMKNFYTKNPKSKFIRTKKANEFVKKYGFKDHEKAVTKEILNFEKRGFICHSLSNVRPDFLAKKNGKIYAVEVEFQNVKPEKYENIKFFNDIIWIKKVRK